MNIRPVSTFGRAALAALLLCCLAGQGLAWSEFGLQEKTEDPAEGPAIREPFFEFLLTMAEVDSLGSWSSADLEHYLTSSGRESRFPLEEVLTDGRAPRITEIGPGIEVLARFGDEPVAVRQGNILGLTFHPELTDDLRIHQAFLDLI